MVKKQERLGKKGVYKELLNTSYDTEDATVKELMNKGFTLEQATSWLRTIYLNKLFNERG